MNAWTRIGLYHALSFAAVARKRVLIGDNDRRACRATGHAPEAKAELGPTGGTFTVVDFFGTTCSPCFGLVEAVGGR